MSPATRRRMRNRIGRGLTFEKMWAMLDKNAEEARNWQKETERIITELGKEMGGLHRSFGEMAEHMVAPGIIDKFNELGFHFEESPELNFKIYGENKKVRTEIDVLLINEEFLIAVEVKARLGKEDIEKHRKRLEILREDSNKTGDRRKILGGMAVAMLGEGDKEAILNAGFYMLEQSGDTMKMDLPEGFMPQEW